MKTFILFCLNDDNISTNTNTRFFFLALRASFFVSLLNVHRGSYMSAHVLLNLSNQLGKRDEMRGLPSIFSLFRNEFNQFKNTRARMLDILFLP